MGETEYDESIGQIYENLINANVNDMLDLAGSDKDRLALSTELINYGKLRAEEKKYTLEEEKLNLEWAKLESNKEIEMAKLENSKKLAPSDILRSVTEVAKTVASGVIGLIGVAAILAAEDVDFKTLSTKAWTLIMKPKA